MWWTVMSFSPGACDQGDGDRAAAEAAVSTLVGVRGVLNRITVPARPAGPQAKAAVRRSLARWLGPDGRRVRVVVRDPRRSSCTAAAGSPRSSGAPRNGRFGKCSATYGSIASW